MNYVEEVRKINLAFAVGFGIFDFAAEAAIDGN